MYILITVAFFTNYVYNAVIYSLYKIYNVKYQKICVQTCSAFITWIIVIIALTCTCGNPGSCTVYTLTCNLNSCNLIDWNLSMLY